MRLFSLFVLTTVVTLSACAARHDVITVTDQKPVYSIDLVSIVAPSDIIGRSVDSELITMERFQFSKDGKHNLLQYKAWHYDNKNQLEYQRVIALSDTGNGETIRQFDPDRIIERQYLKYLSGFLDDDHFFTYGEGHAEGGPEDTSGHAGAILYVHSLSNTDQVQRYPGKYGGVLNNDRFLLGEYAIDWRTGETFPARVGGVRGALTENHRFYFGERNGDVYRLNIIGQEQEFWSSNLFAPLPKPSAGEKYIVALDSDGNCLAWVVTKQRPIGQCTRSESGTHTTYPHRHLAMHPRDDVFVLASGNSAFLYSLEPFGVVSEFLPGKPIYHIGVTPKARLVITTEDDIQVWDLKTRVLIAQRAYRSPRIDRMSSDWGSGAFQYISDDGELLAVKEENAAGEFFIGIYRIP